MTQVEQLTAQAAQWQAAGRADMAAQFYGAALEQDPSKYGIRMQLAECLVALGQPATAAEHYLMVAQAYAARGHQPECLAICDRILSIAPHAFVYMSVGPMVRRIGGQARTVCAKAAEAHLAAGRQTDGLQMLRLGAELDPQNPEVRIQLARIYLSRHMNREAVEALSDAGNLLIQARRYDDYVDIAAQILEVEPGDVQTLRDLPRVYLELGRPQDAVHTLGQLTRVSPGDIVGYEILAQAFAAIGRTDKSLSVLERLVDELGTTGQADKADAILNHARYWRPTDLGFLRSLNSLEVPRPAPPMQAGESPDPREAISGGTVVLSIADLVVDEVSAQAAGPTGPSGSGGVELTGAEGTLTLRLDDLILDERQQAPGPGPAGTKPPGPPPPPPPGARPPPAHKVHAGESTISLDASDLLEALMVTGQADEANEVSEVTMDVPTRPERRHRPEEMSDASLDAPTLPEPRHRADAIAPPAPEPEDDAPTVPPPGSPAGGAAPIGLDGDNPQATTAFYLPQSQLQSHASEDAPAVPPPGPSVSEEALTVPPPGPSVSEEALTIPPPGSSAPLPNAGSASISALIYDEDDADDAAQLDDDDPEPATLLHMKPLTAEDIARAQQGLASPSVPTPASTPAAAALPDDPSRDSQAGLDAPTAFFLPQTLDGAGEPPAAAPTGEPGAAADHGEPAAVEPPPSLLDGHEPPRADLPPPVDHDHPPPRVEPDAPLLGPRPELGGAYDEPTLGPRLGRPDDYDVTLAPLGGPSPRHNATTLPHRARPTDEAEATLVPAASAPIAPDQMGDDAPTLARLQPLTAADIASALARLETKASPEGAPPPPSPEAPPTVSVTSPPLTATSVADPVASPPAPAQGSPPPSPAEPSEPPLLPSAEPSEPPLRPPDAPPFLASGEPPPAADTPPRLGENDDEEMTILNLTALTPEDLARARTTSTDGDAES